MPRMDKAERSEYDRAYRAKNKDRKSTYEAKWRAENAAHLKARSAKRRLEKRAMCLIAGARTRSRNKGIEFDLDDFAENLQSRIDAGKCELTGVSFDLSPGRSAISPSIDRINPDLGYTKENVRVVCHAMNAALGDWGERELAKIVTSWLLSKNAINAKAAEEFIRCVI